MVHVVASLRIKEGKLEEFLELFRALAVDVKKEKGCIEYLATIDLDADVPPQTLEKNVVTTIEKWESPEALHAHSSTPHMTAQREKEKGMVELVSLKILKEV
jgi:quinol monooxygenase YgiN